MFLLMTKGEFILKTKLFQNLGYLTSERQFLSSASANVEEPDPVANLSKSSLALKIAEEHDLSKAQSRRIVDSVFDSIVESVLEKRPVSLTNFGTFSAYKMKERKAYNFRTKEIMKIPARDGCKFKLSKSFKELLIDKS